MVTLGGLELEIGLLDRGLGLGGRSLECSGLSNMRVGGGHGRRRSEKGELDANERKKGEKYNSRLLLFVRKKTQERVRVKKATSIGSRKKHIVSMERDRRAYFMDVVDLHCVDASW